MSILNDYNDKAFELEIESQAIALKAKRQLIKEESEMISKRTTEELKIID